MKRYLEIGPGQARLGDGWATVDCRPRSGLVDYICRWGDEPLPFADDSFDLVYAGHVLEHVPWFHTVGALVEARRVLKRSGVIEVHVPDLDVLIRAVQERRCLDDHAEGTLNQEGYWMHWVAERLFHIGPEPEWHHGCFNACHLEYCLHQAGFYDVSKIDKERGASHGIINLGMRATK